MSGVLTAQDAAALVADLSSVSLGRTVIWDFDGVVADTEPIHDVSYQVLSRRRGWEPPEGYFLPMVGHTEDVIWERLMQSGLPSVGDRDEDIRSLVAARREVFSELAERELEPSWLSRALMPALQGVAREQLIVSNGDPDVIERLIHLWTLSDYVRVVRREPGSDKRALLAERLSAATVLLEDDARWLAMGRDAGALTVAVRHAYNGSAHVSGDFTVTL